MGKLMPNPTTAWEWAKNCQTLGHLRKVQEHLVEFPDLLLRALCETCADAYARQQVEAAAQHLEHLAQTAPLRSRQSTIYRQCAAAIRARSVDG